MASLELKFDDAGLIPTVVQDERGDEVLMVAFMNRESLQRTIETGETHFWSRSRQSLWHKGETSGNTQRVVSITADCDGDALLLRVVPAGPACHTGKRSCFFQDYPSGAELGDRSDARSAAGEFGRFLERLRGLIEKRKAERPEGSYTTYLFDSGLDKILKKVGEESAETIIAAKNESAERLTSEIADLFYHLLVLMVERKVSLDALAAELESRSARRKPPRAGKDTGEE